MSKHVGIPIKVLHDAEGHTVTVELKNGEVFRGKLDEAEDNMNVHLSNCTKTAKDGKVSTLANCFLRGSHVRFMILPDILKNAPFFKKIDTKANKAAGARAARRRRRRSGRRAAASGRRRACRRRAPHPAGQEPVVQLSSRGPPRRGRARGAGRARRGARTIVGG